MKEFLTPKPNSKVPDIYRRLAEFDIRGVITTNIDDLLLKALTEAVHDKLLKPVYGKSISDRLEILIRERPFFFQMHGNISAERTWVFTHEELTEIQESKAHKKFLDAVYFTNTVVFVGVSADDISVSGRLVELRESDIATPPHYWITPDTHNRKRDWAEANGIRQIVYSSAAGHDKCINAILDYVKAFRSTAANIDTVVIDARGAKISERDPTRLSGLPDIDQIRQSLNGLIFEARDKDGRIAFDEYSKICSRYRRAVATAYLLPESDGEKWFGYEIDRSPLGGRTFGSVYSARSPDGSIAAIKILQQRRFAEPAYLSAFRRGAEALRILERYQVKGVARLREAYELPPTLIMEFEYGTTLDQIIPTGKAPPDLILNVISQCSRIVRSGHGLPQTVMHRDIKPSNIMLRGFDWDSFTFDDVVMFDFDFGWYKGAEGDDATRTDPESLGFQAPEQLQATTAYTKRSTLVDSFGLGITLYYCLSGVVPSVGVTDADDWERRVDGACRRAFSGDMVTAKRCARLIIACTDLDQRKRPDSSLMSDDLDDLLHWRAKELSECSTDFIAEAIISLATEGEYSWDRNRRLGYYTFQSGMALKCSFDPIENELALEFRFEDPTNVNRRNLDQRITDLPAFANREAEKLQAQSKRIVFPATRQVDGKVVWLPEVARMRALDIGAFARSIGRWFAAL